jgi:hypothetical protein
MVEGHRMHTTGLKQNTDTTTTSVCHETEISNSYDKVLAMNYTINLKILIMLEHQ